MRPPPPIPLVGQGLHSPGADAISCAHRTGRSRSAGGRPHRPLGGRLDRPDLPVRDTFVSGSFPPSRRGESLARHVLATFPAPALSEGTRRGGYRDACSIARSLRGLLDACSIPRRGPPQRGAWPPGDAGRPRAASQAPPPPDGGAQTACSPGAGRGLRQSQVPDGPRGSAASFARLTGRQSLCEAKWRRGVGRQARQSGGGIVLSFKRFSQSAEK